MAENDDWEKENSLSGEEISAVFHPPHAEQETFGQDSGKTNDSEKQIPVILEPKNRSALLSIINELDPSSFVKWARTCRAMNDICFDSKDIKVNFKGITTVEMSHHGLSPPSEAPEAIIQIGHLFSPGLRDGLIKIVNQLDAASFAKFAETCKHIHDFCYNTHGIQVEFGEYDMRSSHDSRLCRVNVYVQVGSKTNIRMVLRRKCEDKIHYHTVSTKEQKSLFKSPFIITITELFFTPNVEQQVDYRVFVKLSRYLRRFRRIRLGKINAATVDDWNSFAGLIQEFGANQLQIGESWRQETLPVDLLPIFLNKVDEFQYCGHVPDELILSATSKHLYLPNAMISKETFKELIKKFRDGSVHHWAIGRAVLYDLPFDDDEEEDEDDELTEDSEDKESEHEFDDEDEDEFDDEDEDFEFDEHDPFVKACSEVMEVVHVEDISKLDMKPSVIYATSKHFGRMFCLQKSDGSIGDFFIERDAVVFGRE